MLRFTKKSFALPVVYELGSDNSCVQGLELMFQQREILEVFTLLYLERYL